MLNSPTRILFNLFYIKYLFYYDFMQKEILPYPLTLIRRRAF
jgi:hypothetical protein